MFDDDWIVSAVARRKDDETDNLMRLAAPRERLALGAIALFVVAAAVASTFGVVSRSLLLNGELHRAGEDGSWQASLLAAPDVARQVELGMAVRVELVGPSEAVLILPGEVVESHSASSSGAPADERSAPNADARRIAVAVDASAVPGGLVEPILPDGSPCRVAIALGRQSILRALASS